MAATTYKVATGHNNASGLRNINPQPRNESDVMYEEFLYGLEGSVILQGQQFVTFTFNALSYADYLALLTQFGLSLTTFNANVTVSLRKDDDTYANYNGIASHVTGKQRGYGFWRNVEIIVSRLAAI